MKSYRFQDILDLPKEYRRNFVNSLSGYKSLCLCGTINFEGQTNLSLMNSVQHVGANPPLMGMLIRPDVVPRHTLRNIETTGYYTLNHVTEAIYRQAHQASANYPAEVSEFDATGLAEEYGTIHPAPYVAQAVIQIGLIFQERHQILANATQFVVGRIVEVRIAEDILRPDGYIDPALAGSLAGAGLDGYYEGRRLARLAYARPNQEAKEIDT
ncbi:MAG: flavin reductase [Bacteroidia bacterium]